MLNEMLTGLLHFSIKFCETVFQSSDRVQRNVSLHSVRRLSFSVRCRRPRANRRFDFDAAVRGQRSSASIGFRRALQAAAS